MRVGRSAAAIAAVLCCSIGETARAHAEAPPPPPPLNGAAEPADESLASLLQRQAALKAQMDDVTAKIVAAQGQAPPPAQPPPPIQAPAPVQAPPLVKVAAKSVTAAQNTKAVQVPLAHCAAATGKDPDIGALANLKFGGDGPSTQKTICDTGDASILANTSSTLSSTGISYSYNGVSKLSNVNVAAALGYTQDLSIFANPFDPSGQQRLSGSLTPYLMIDRASQTTETLSKDVIARQTAYTAKFTEAGFVYRTNNFHIADLLDHGSTDNSPTFQVLAQPFYLDDNLRHSRSWAANISFFPIRAGINEFNRARPQSDQVDSLWSGFSYGMILEGNLDSAFFVAKGTSLSAAASAKASTSGFQPYIIPNEDYSRIGGKIGAFGELLLPAAWQGHLASGILTGSVYYANYAALSGVRHDYGEFVGDLTLPITSLFSLSADYTNGRTENIATRVQSFQIGVKFGGH